MLDQVSKHIQSTWSGEGVDSKFSDGIHLMQSRQHQITNRSISFLGKVGSKEAREDEEEVKEDEEMEETGPSAAEEVDRLRQQVAAAEMQENDQTDDIARLTALFRQQQQDGLGSPRDVSQRITSNRDFMNSPALPPQTS